MSPQSQKESPELTVYFVPCFFPAENKAIKRRQSIRDDLGLIISKNLYVSNKANPKPRKHEQKRPKQAPSKEPEAQSEEATRHLGEYHFFPAGDEAVGPAHECHPNFW